MNILVIVYLKVFAENPKSGKCQHVVNFYSQFINFVCYKWNADIL